MSTALLSSPVATLQPAGQRQLVDQRQPADRRRRLEHPYPLFGFRRQVHRLPRLDRHLEIQEWLLRQDQQQPREAWPARWLRCQQERRAFFKEVWVVRLPRASRWLTPGDYVFDPLTDFLHIPGSPPQAVSDGYQQAFAELPRHRFVYLDLLWDPTPEGLKLLTAEQAQASALKQEQRFRQRLRHDRLLIEAAQARQREMLARMTGRRPVAESIRSPATPGEARRILGMSDDRLQRSLQSQLELIEFAKYDPVIVFEEPALLRRAGGHMPLGLIAHWD